MNYLAHCFLSCSDDNLLIGNLIGDMLRNRDLKDIDQSILVGVNLHRSIDTFTDQHPASRRSARLLHERHGKYAPVIVDIFFDYFLHQNWGLYTDMSFNAFKSLVYHQIQTNQESIPAKAKDRLLRMVQGDWLESYGSIEGLDFVFSRVAKRAKFDSNFPTATQDLIKHNDALQEEFKILFKDLQEHVNIFCGC